MEGGCDLREEGEEEQRTRDLGTEVVLHREDQGKGSRREGRGGGSSRNIAPRSVQGRQAKEGRHGIGKTKNKPRRKP